MIKVFYIPQDGSGFAQEFETEDNTTVSTFTTARGITNPNDYVFRVRSVGQPSLVPLATQVLQNLDRISATPKKVLGAAAF